MGKRIAMSVAIVGMATMMIRAQRDVTISGTVRKVSEPDMKVSVYIREGATNIEVATTTVAADHTYELHVPIGINREATLDCGHWQNVQVWLCDESLNIDFEGVDTLQARTNEPLYVDQRGGRNAELMNLINQEMYRNFVSQTANSIIIYKSSMENETDSDASTDNANDKKRLFLENIEEKKRMTQKLNGAVGDNTLEYMRFLVKHYNDRPAVMAALRHLDAAIDEELIDATLALLAASSSEGHAVVDDYLARIEHERELRERTAPGNMAPDFTFQDTQGHTVRLSDYLGKKVVVLDFWASWCMPCRKEIPRMKEYYKEFENKGVEFLSVSLDTDRKAWQKAMRQERMPWPQGWAPDNKVMDTYQFNSIPHILVIDRQGRIYRDFVRGSNTRYALEDAIIGR